jgi:iron-sulfur cluster repair protein YtfE (RIC family)
LLYECHGRIRNFLALAARLAAAPDSPPEMVRESASQIRRYFAEAFPLHLADEDELVLPALLGHDENLDNVLAIMHGEHADHAALVARMIVLCEALQADPRQLVARAAELASATTALQAALEPHLLREEHEIFAALRALRPAQRDAIKAGRGCENDAKRCCPEMRNRIVRRPEALRALRVFSPVDASDAAGRAT